MNQPRINQRLCCLAVTLFCFPASAFADWIKPMDPPSDPVPDVDKVGEDRTCWLATAANMLGAAGYGDGATAQLRAEDVYEDLRQHYPPVE